ncbi:MAG TPA: CocE/NonD family hydrolase [Gaiellaceae bacterium]
MVRTAIALCIAALLCTGVPAAARAGGPTTENVTITGAGGVQLACEFVLPAGTAPDGGWPGLVLFPGLGAVPPIDGDSFATAGFASVSCAERGTGSSGGAFDLAGPNDAKDAQAIFDWLAARPEVSDTEIGAEGWELGGAEVWNAAAAGVPFKAIVPADTWSSLHWALEPTGVLNVSLFNLLSGEGPTTWNTSSGIAARSHRGSLHSLTVPTLIVGERSFFFFDLSQATAAYRLLAGPKRLDIGWNADRLADVVAWLQHYLAGGPKIGGGVEIQHEQPDTATTKYVKLPPSRAVTVNLPGSALTRSVWLPGGPLETFGRGSVTIRYSGASWRQVVATVSTADGKEVTEGAAAVKGRAGVLTIPLLNEMRLLPRGQKLTVTLSSHDSTFGGAAGGTIAVGRMTLRLSVLARAVSH